MEKNDFKVVIKDRFFEALNIIKLFQKEIIEDSTEVGKIRATLISMNKQDPNLSAEDVKPMLVEAQVKDYNISLMEMDLRSNYIRPLIEYKVLADMFKVDLDLDEVSLKFTSAIMEGNDPMYVILNNKVVPRDKEAHLLYMDKVKTTFSGEQVLDFALKSLTKEDSKKD
jgi:hypothetical protein